MGDGLARIEEQQTIMHIQTGILKGYFKQNPYHVQRLDIFSIMEKTFTTIIFTKNSPLAPLFSRLRNLLRNRIYVELCIYFRASERIRDSGMQSFLSRQWEGDDIDESWPTETETIGIGQVILVVIVLCVGYVACALLLFAEVAFTWTLRNYRQIYQIATERTKMNLKT